MAASDDIEFGEALWSFIREGGYIYGVRENGSARYYRFRLPEKANVAGTGMPAEIELF